MCWSKIFLLRWYLATMRKLKRGWKIDSENLLRLTKSSQNRTVILTDRRCNTVAIVKFFQKNIIFTDNTRTLCKIYFMKRGIVMSTSYLFSSGKCVWCICLIVRLRIFSTLWIDGTLFISFSINLHVGQFESRCFVENFLNSISAFMRKRKMKVATDKYTRLFFCTGVCRFMNGAGCRLFSLFYAKFSKSEVTFVQ